jgi:iron complex outermembrane receptor protein
MLPFPVFVNPATSEMVAKKQKQLKKLIIAIAITLGLQTISAQTVYKGRVVEKNVASAVVNATIKTNNGTTFTDEQGMFRISAKPGTAIEISSVGFRTFAGTLSDSALPVFYLERNNSLMAPVEINAIRASDLSPFTKTTLSARSLEKLNTGQDLPFLLNQLPSVVVNSDAGNGIGYTGIRIRGTDPTRINMTINGIPYNDAESQGIFFVNLPDLSSSLNSIQVQRGVGTSSNGAGAFGATMNLLTNEVNELPHAELNNSYGSFNTWKNTVKAGTGLINEHFSFDARLSRIKSDGYMDRASTNLSSFFVSGAYIGKNNSLRLNVFSGREKTYQSWYGVPESLLETNRTFNSAGTERPGAPYDNETDNYTQTHYQLFYNQALNPSLNLNVAMFYTRGLGYYEQYKAGEQYAKYGLPDHIVGADTARTTDLIRQLWLDNHFFGNTFSLQYKKPLTELIVGGGWTKYLGNHYGRVIWAGAGVPDQYTWYNHNANKSDVNLYVKWQQKISEHVRIFADLQGRRVVYNIYGFRDNPNLTVENNWFFVNPKAGISYSKKNWFAYLSYAVANKEPNRDDFEAGANKQPLAEHLRDLELGVERRDAVLSWGATLFYMKYRDQLVLTGEINDVGAYTRTNIPESYRLGLELTASWKPKDWIDLAANLALSENKLKNYSAYYDDYDNGGQKSETLEKGDIAFSPKWVGGATINIRPFSRAEVSLISKYVSRQFLDNTSRDSRSLEAFFVQDLRVSYRIIPKFMKEIFLVGQVNNLYNKRYEPNGYSFSYYYGGTLQTENFYYPMAGTNLTVALNLRF